MLQVTVEHSLLVDQLLDDCFSLVKLVTHNFFDVFVLLSKDAEGYGLVLDLFAGDLSLVFIVFVF